MNTINRVLRLASAAVLATVTLGNVARSEEGSKFAWSVTVGGTSDYVFRGISLNTEDPAFQSSVDASYGIFYAGVWGSNVAGDFGPAEIDLYAGIKPVLGPVTFDLGAVYYWYPGGDDDHAGAELDYYELKAGASVTPITNLALSTVFYWTPDVANDLGEAYAVEGTAAYTLPAIRAFTPTISGTVGYAESDELDTLVVGTDNYTYWNAGLALAVEKFTFDFRYWDTDVASSSSTYGTADERFVFSAKVTLP